MQAAEIVACDIREEETARERCVKASMQAAEIVDELYESKMERERDALKPVCRQQRLWHECILAFCGLPAYWLSQYAEIVS